MVRQRPLQGLPLPLTALLAAAGLLLVAWVSIAQASEIRMPGYHSRAVNVNVSFNAQIPVADTSEAALTAAQAELRRSFYRMAREECTHLLAEIAESCSLVHLNVNTSVQNYNNQTPMMNANSNAGYAITLKP